MNHPDTPTRREERILTQTLSQYMNARRAEESKRDRGTTSYTQSGKGRDRDKEPSQNNISQLYLSSSLPKSNIHLPNNYGDRPRFGEFDTPS